MGKTVEKIWLNIQEHYPFTALDEYIIMPNHIHGIIIIDYDVNVVGDENFRPLHKTNLSNVIKGFKIGVTKWCKAHNHNNFKWQRSFYERIIRNEKELFHIRKYIQQNPLKWELNKNINNQEI